MSNLLVFSIHVLWHLLSILPKFGQSSKKDRIIDCYDHNIKYIINKITYLIILYYSFPNHYNGYNNDYLLFVAMITIGYWFIIWAILTLGKFYTEKIRIKKIIF